MCDFEYIALLASNELFVKKGLYGYIKDYDAGLNDGIIPVTTRTRTGKCSHKDPVLKNMMDDMKTNDIYWSQIEGSFYKKNIFSKMCAVIDKFFDYRLIGAADLYAREEVYFPTVFWGLYRQDKQISISAKGMFTFVPWGRLTLSVNLPEAIREADNTSHIYCIKRVARKMNDPVRMFVRQKYGYSHMSSQTQDSKALPICVLLLLDIQRRVFQSIDIYKNLISKKIGRWL